MGSSLKLGSLLGSLFLRVPYYIGDLKRDPSLENHPYRGLCNKGSGYVFP